MALVKKLFVLIAFILAFPPASFSQGKSPTGKETMNYSGRKLTRKNSDFAVTGIRIRESKSKKSVLFTVYFNDIIDTSSVKPANILLNGNALSDDTQLRFNKSRSVLQFTIQKNAGWSGNSYSIEINEVRSYDQRVIQTFKAENLKDGSLIKNRMRPNHRGEN